MRQFSTLSLLRQLGTAIRGESRAARTPTRSTKVVTAAIMALTGLPFPAHAVDGCLVLLCLAAPDWRAIAQCVDPIYQLLSDLRHGRPFPHCSFSGAGNDARHDWASAPENCPPQYARYADLGESSKVWVCDYTGVISVRINGAAWSRVWWGWDSDTVTEYSQDAKQQLGTWSTKFDDDYAAWLAIQPPAEPPNLP